MAEKLLDLGVSTDIQIVPFEEIKKNLQDPKFAYDIILTGVNL
jgi:hypothetical protein